jgi:hypothetical protein
LQEETAILYGENKKVAAQRADRFRRAYQTLGAPGYWRTNLEQVRSDWRRRPGDSYNLAVLYARVGDNYSAFIWLEKAYQTHSQELIFGLRTDPAFDVLRPDPKYLQLVRRIGFPG